MMNEGKSINQSNVKMLAINHQSILDDVIDQTTLPSTITATSFLLKKFGVITGS